MDAQVFRMSTMTVNNGSITTTIDGNIKRHESEKGLPLSSLDNQEEPLELNAEEGKEEKV